jgi:hypothetical protein
MKKTIKPDIKPCPFCTSTMVELHRNFDFVKCNFCGANGHFYDGHPEDAIESWNMVSKLRKEYDNEKNNQA